MSRTEEQKHCLKDMPDQNYVQYRKGLTDRIIEQNDNYSSTDVDFMELLKSETFLLQIEHVNMEENTDDDWTDL